MCGSYRFDPVMDGRFKDLCDRLGEGGQGLANLAEQLYPNSAAIALISELGEVVPKLMQWGFPGFSGRKYIYNARVETVDLRPMFQSSVQTRRCALPATSFFEWDRSRRKYSFSLDGEQMYLAGIFNEYMENDRFCILTTEANSSVMPVHGRMPVVLREGDVEPYLASYKAACDMIHTAQPELVSTLVADKPRGIFGQRALFSDGEREV